MRQIGFDCEGPFSLISQTCSFRKSSRSVLVLKDDVIILPTRKKIGETSVIISQLVLKVELFPFCLNF